MKKIKEIIVVEGKTDTDVIQSLFDVETIETHGSRINQKTLDLIKQASESRGVIILTDPDYPGMRIRDKIVKAVPHAKHAFVERKDAIGRKKLGIAEARREAIIEAIENAVTFEEREDSLTWQEFLELDIIGDKRKREYVYHTFRLGYGNNKTLFKRLNMVGITKQQIKDILK